MTVFDCIKDPYYKHKYVLERILMELLNFKREELILHYDDVLDAMVVEKTRTMYDEYAIGKQPLEYILGYVEYGWLRFHVNQHTIIPRPETEYMIEEVRKYISWKAEKLKGWKEKALKPLRPWALLVDVGTGSGVLGLSILHSHGSQIEQTFLIDISEEALAVAKGNYDHLVNEGKIDEKIGVVIEKGNLLEVESWKLRVKSEGNVVIVANLPYIPDETFDTNPDQSIKFEPRVAFVGGDDGLDLYRVMFNQLGWKAEELKSWQEKAFEPLNFWASVVMFLEMMTWQVDILRKEFEWLEFEEIATFHFQIRIVRVQYKV